LCSIAPYLHVKKGFGSAIAVSLGDHARNLTHFRYFEALEKLCDLHSSTYLYPVIVHVRPRLHVSLDLGPLMASADSIVPFDLDITNVQRCLELHRRPDVAARWARDQAQTKGGTAYTDVRLFMHAATLLMS
jgi:hypothetical protein